MSNAVTRQPHSRGKPNKSFKRDDRAQDLRQVGRGDGDLGQHPEHRLTRGEYSARHACARSCPVTTPSRAARVCKSTAIRFDISKHPDQRIAEPRAPFQVRRPVARVHVTDAHQVGRPQKNEKPPEPGPPSGRRRNGDRPVDFLQRFSFRACLLHHCHHRPRGCNRRNPRLCKPVDDRIDYLYLIFRFPARGRFRNRNYILGEPNTPKNVLLRDYPSPRRDDGRKMEMTGFASAQL